MNPHRLDDDALSAAVSSAFMAGKDNADIPFTLYACLVGGIKAADASLNVRLNVTMAERAAGAMRGESAVEVAVRETRHTAAKALAEISEKVQQAADAQAEFHALCSEADILMTTREDEADDREFWRLRASLRAIRDTLEDSFRAGSRLPKPAVPDLNAAEAWAPLAPSYDAKALRPALTAKMAGVRPETLYAVLSVQESLTVAARGAPVVWRDLTPTDIAGMTRDHTIRHLLTKAAALRDEAVAVSGTDPERAGRILAEVTSVEHEAMDAAMHEMAASSLDRVESLTAVLKDRSNNEISK